MLRHSDGGRIAIMAHHEGGAECAHRCLARFHGERPARIRRDLHEDPPRVQRYVALVGIHVEARCSIEIDLRAILQRHRADLAH